MVNVQSLGIKDNFKDYIKFFAFALDNPRLTFKGYNGTYYYKNLAQAEFSVAVTKDREGKKTLTGFGTHVMGNHNYKMRIDEVLENNEMSALCICTPLEGNPVSIPVSFVLSDVLPSILPGDTVVFQGVAALSSGSFFFSQEEAEEKMGWKDQRYMGGELHLTPRLIFYRLDPSLEKDYTPIYTKIKSYEKHPCLSQIDTNYFAPLYTLEADSPFGDITIAVAEEDLPPEVMERLDRNEEVYLYGIINFSGDVGIEEYQQGAIFDEEHLLRVLRQALETGEFERLWKNMAEDCSYYGYCGRSLKGRDEIIKKMKEVWDAQHENEKDIQHQAIGTITEVLVPQRAKYRVGKRCLLPYCDPSQGIMCFNFIKVENGKISTLEFIYDLLYHFEADLPEENPEEKISRNMKIVKAEKSPEEWKDFILSWLGGEEKDSVEFYAGIEPECTANILGKELCDKEDIYVKVKDLINMNISPSSLDITVKTSDDGRIERLEIVKVIQK